MRSGMVRLSWYIFDADGCRVLDSIKASKRLSEANFALNIAPNGLRSVLGMFKR